METCLMYIPNISFAMACCNTLHKQWDIKKLAFNSTMDSLFTLFCSFCAVEAGRTVILKKYRNSRRIGALCGNMPFNLWNLCTVSLFAISLVPSFKKSLVCIMPSFKHSRWVVIIKISFNVFNPIPLKSLLPTFPHNIVCLLFQLWKVQFNKIP